MALIMTSLCTRVCVRARACVCVFVGVSVCVCVLLPMPKWRDEVEAAVDSVILDVLSVQPALIPEILLELLIYVVCDRFPAGTKKTPQTMLAAPPSPWEFN